MAHERRISWICVGQSLLHNVLYCGGFLEGDGLSFSRHSAVIAAFGREFARKKRVEVEFHRYLIEAQEVRHSGDYGERQAVNFDQAQVQIDRAEEFLELAQRLIGPLSVK